ncbi:hypothetical protein ERW51_10965 [Aliivibrio finisterrensis]|uniref:hypothetical protein n=1 Tax=Aliivibrio finisterrensis TaxID=511998 RepID=UPI0010214BF4|nr:hypothetical protein [Aliivibrio finisterrensis]RYU67545.1 hypothetical protein ERW54_11695 [Aliivibrio finisterrensis]RYU70978.1 hypothetical protein ERW51_10965 [Aliivibrio finisterrensis]RYU74539.1 hypothetical protein ERW48_10550 [Aliivibrio finisterrensis]
MAMLPEVNTKLAKFALQECEGFPFEEFANDFLSAIEGKSFIPVGGVADGGADGAKEEGLFSTERIGTFYQVSIEENHRSKVKKTVDRLAEFGRDVRQITYVTSQTIKTFDREEEHLSDKHDIFIRIRDAKWILSNLNHNEATKKAYYTHLERYTDCLKDINNGSRVRINSGVKHPSVYVFLQQQVDNREKDKHLTKTVADSLIFWALNDTDPEKDKFMIESEITTFIFDNIPWAKTIISSMLSDRLKELSSKGGVSDKKINRHKDKLSKKFMYCLPFETRLKIAEEKAVDEELKSNVIDEIVSFESLNSLEPDEKHQVADISIRVAQMFFEKEGLNCSSFLNNKKIDNELLIENTVFDRVKDALEEFKIHQDKVNIIQSFVCDTVRKMFYQSTEAQRLLLNKFSRTYVLLFTLQAEPRVIEYFQKATANFRLLIGTDLIIRALSERFLSVENQMTRNMFKMASESGISLLLTEPSLDGLKKHLIVADNEYKNHIYQRESYLSVDLIHESEQILIRTYFHAKSEGYTKTWKQFISEFVTYEELHNNYGTEELKAYITNQFNMEYYSKSELSKGIDQKKIDDLSFKILDIKKGNQELANSTALTIHSVYSERSSRREFSTFPEFGYQTWWLTQESRVQKLTLDLVKENGAKFIMRPEFLLNFFSLAPSVENIRDSYRSIFPTVMGIQMGNRLPDNIFHKVLKQVDEWRESDDGKIAAKTRLLCDRLKSEHSDSSLSTCAIDKIISEIE